MRMCRGVAFLSNDHIWVGILGNTFMAWIGPGGYIQASSMPHVRQMEFSGKPVKANVFFKPDRFASDQAIEYRVHTSYGIAVALPPNPATKQRSAILLVGKGGASARSRLALPAGPVGG